MSAMETLDNEIGDLQAKIAILQAHRANLSTILLSQPHLPARLEQRPVQHEGHRRKAAKLVEKQSKRNLENVYRACAGVTAFKVKDPDPYAVDDGNVLGVRIEVAISGRFIETYNVLFNRPDAQYKMMLKIHKHTIPPCIPLQALANKWLPMTRKDVETATEQNLVKFGRSLRKELVSWHMRLEAITKLRSEAGVEDEAARPEEAEEPAAGRVLNAFMSSDDESDEDDEELQRRRNSPVKIMELEADAAGREITLTWTNGRVGIMKVTKDGEVEKAVVKDEDGTRDAALGRKAIGRIEGLVQRLAA
ncbi:hypothetical protein P280DRAFT_467049 [Massarina eburnea CBS 473.64]|uniref:Cenp-O kinetochore centromere component n=1 Tax=Massarina eburnea CBS 473.64 TaxID=1395130 RepID=A0A6A6S7F0_9PLEO|nr:hypothetical protein P280DRAFT_467049 [Massarina eburnea CBS 473.64]